MKNLNEFISAWLNVADCQFSGAKRILVKLITALLYIPFLLFVTVSLLYGDFAEDFFVPLIPLLIAMLLHSTFFRNGLLPRIEYTSSLFVLPIVLLVVLTLEVLSPLLKVSLDFAKIGFVLGVLVFVFLGVLGVLLFGVKQFF